MSRIPLGPRSDPAPGATTTSKNSDQAFGQRLLHLGAPGSPSEIALGGLAYAFVGGGGAGGGAKRLGGGGGGTFLLIGELGTCWLEEEDPLARCVLLSSSCNKGNSCSINHDADLAAVINVFLHVFATFGFVLYA